MSNVKQNGGRGFSLIEAIVAMATIGIASLGTLSYQYHGARQIRIAECQLAATRVGQLLLEDWKAYWKANGDSPAYNPASLNFGFTSSTSTSFGGGGVFTGKITVDGIAMEVRLSLPPLQQPLGFTPKAGTGTLQSLQAQIRYTTDGSNPTADSPTVTFTTYVIGG